MNGPEQHSDLDNTDFERVSEALRAGESEQPPASLDAAVMKEAARATQPSSRKSGRLHRWLVSGALAATLVLSVSLTVQLMVPGTAPMSTMSEFQETKTATPAGAKVNGDGVDGDEVDTVSVDNTMPALAYTDTMEEAAIDDVARSNVPAAPGRVQQQPLAAPATSAVATEQDSVTDTSMEITQRERNTAVVEGPRPVPTVTQEDIDSAGNLSFDVLRSSSVDPEGIPQPGQSTETVAEQETREQSQIEITGSRIKRVDIEGPQPAPTYGERPPDFPTERYAGMTTTDRVGLREIVEAQQFKDRKEFLETYLNSNEYRHEVYGDPDRWLAGISDLIDMGEIALAKNELDDFRLAYPGYELEERFEL